MSKKQRIGLIKLIVSISLLVIVFTQVGRADVISALAQAKLGWLGLALAMYFVGVLVRASRWRLLLPQPNGPAVRLRRLVQLYFASFFFNSFLPTGIGGDVIRITEVTRAFGLSTAASSVIADRAIGLIAAGLLALMALPWVGGNLSWPLALTTGVVAIGIPIGFWLLTRYRPTGTSPANHLPVLVRPIVNRMLEVAKALMAYPRRVLVRALVVSLAFALTNVLVYVWIGAALNIDLSLAYYILVSPIITLILLIPISVNGLGTRDVIYQALFVPVGVAPQAALAMSLIYHAFNLIAAIIGGVVYAFMGLSGTTTSGERAN
jgi:uncharacterized membrane protein YbhN (UPF0104 family)